MYTNKTSILVTLLLLVIDGYVHCIKPSVYINYHKYKGHRIHYITNYTEYGAKIVRTEVYHNQYQEVVCSCSYAEYGNHTGWNIVLLWANPSYDSDVTAKCLGVVEGDSTFKLIYEYYYNTVVKFCDDKKDICKKIEDFIDRNTFWIQGEIDTYKDKNSYWYQVYLVYKQIEGLIIGYQGNDTPPIPDSAFIWMNLAGDLEDLVDKFKPKGSPPRKLYDEGHCSAIVKLLPDNKDLYVGHVAWNSYNTMTRMLKFYSYNFKKEQCTPERIPGTNTSFSGYPGTIHSFDDFYLTSAGLAIQETTIGNSNRKLWKYVKPVGTIFEFVRVTVANRLARSGEEWTRFFRLRNSGTYNNQWMIVDYKKFQKGVAPKKDLLWVLEQIPGNIRAEDQTGVLINQTYWPSYNIPYYKDIFTLAGNEELVKEYGPWFSYDGAPRAKIFKRDHSKIINMDTFMAFMRSNDYKNDPFSKCDCTPPYSASNAIAARHDLNPKNGTYPIPYLGNRPGGAIDAKIVNSVMFKDLQFVAVSGPTDGNKKLPIFNWNTTEFKDTVRHLGQPTVWNFDPVIFDFPIDKMIYRP